MCIVLLSRTAVCKLLSGRIPILSLIVAVTVYIAVEGSRGIALHHHWTFIVLIILMLLSLGFTVISDCRRKSLSALMSHLGFFMVLFGGLFGAPDRIDAQMRLFLKEDGEHIAADRGGHAVPLPFNISLEEFKTDLYDDGTSPKQFTSTLSIDGKVVDTSVNHPCRYKGYRIYQSGYDAAGSQYSVLKIVRNPWLPIGAAGALLLMIGAFLNLQKVWNSWKMLAAALILAIVFGIVSVARINFGTLPPALRSLWFVPHLIVYMLAYAIMAISFIAGIASLFSARIPEGIVGKLLNTASSLLLIGMICGAVWAQQAWGDYWTWDPKECWAAATWLLTLAGTHFPKKKSVLVFTILAFISIQMTWYGVNYLPSSTGSLHTYNQSK
ncbi:MAG: cytochrome c biogenesis protein ResB [Bacteroidia bacterium]|nr:cytochrome c biogenesis protein ResB [Bacteroidia bacterium]